MSTANPLKLNALRAIDDSVLAVDMEFKERLTSGGIIVPNDDMKSSGIRPRWAKVYSIGPEQKDIKVGQYILIAHGRWTRGISIEDAEGVKTVRKVDINDIMLVSDDPVKDETMSNKGV